MQMQSVDPASIPVNRWQNLVFPCLLLIGGIVSLFVLPVPVWASVGFILIAVGFFLLLVWWYP
ncbi:MAG TPA: hypothetical protein VFP95_06870, partial [Gammaproteobacteria bacterium]|nr:hypothetical protein [Gammaproteobacteria bacterium]